MKTDADRASPRYEALILLLRTADTLWNASRVFFGRWDLSPSQFNILNLLTGESGGVSQIELSRQLLMHRSNVTGLVDRLEKRGLVRRQEVPGDRRAYCVELTEAGRGVMREILPRYHAAAEQVWGDLSAKRIGEVSGALGIVCANAGRTAETLSKGTSV